MKKLLYIGTHPQQTNGYSKVVYNHLREFGKHAGVYVVCYGIQYNDSANKHRIIDSNNVVIHTASAQQNGFAFDELEQFVKICTPDMIFIYNDPYVVQQYLKKLENYQCVKWTYLDLVYPNMNNTLIEYIKSQVTQMYVFDKKTKENYQFENAKVLYHGQSNHMVYSKIEACEKLGIKDDLIYVLNLNRNQPRKRYDIFIKSVVQFYAKYAMPNVKFVLATHVKGSFDLLQIFSDECRKQHVTLEFTEVFVIVENPQMLDDEIIELLYSASDIGINTCDGEGWGLCNFEHMAYGAPQIVPEHSCFLEYCNEENSILLKPKWSYYVDSGRDANGGEAFVVDPNDVVDAVFKYCNDVSMRKDHGECAKNDVQQVYTWSQVIRPLMEDVFAIAA